MDIPEQSATAVNSTDLSARDVWLRISACFAIVIVSCGIKNYIAVVISDTALCPYLCPSFFSSEFFFEFPLLESAFEGQVWIEERSQEIADFLFIDPWHLATTLIIAPIYEELFFRGPMYLTKRASRSWLWWLAGIALSFVFAMSHGRNGLALVPLIALGVCGVWLIANTRRFWPTIVLHFLHNFFFSSARIYQLFTFGDY